MMMFSNCICICNALQFALTSLSISVPDHLSCLHGLHAFMTTSKQSCFLCACRAPEQVDKEFGLRGSHTDVWGFATTVLHLATGHLPYQGLTHLQIMFAMSKGRAPEVPSSLPEWLQQALTSCLSFDTAARPSVSQLHQVRLFTLSVLTFNLRYFADHTQHIYLKTCFECRSALSKDIVSAFYMVSWTALFISSDGG